MNTPQNTLQNDDTSEILIWQEGPIGRLRLNRPKALNTITPSMITDMTQALVQWGGNDSVTTIILDASGERAFCAGGDIRQLSVLGKSDLPAARQFLFDEYRLNTLIANYPKPFVAIMDGLTLGGGIGVAAHASHRIVTRASSLALPETKIGFFPDVGSTYRLSRTPGNIGVYLGVTGMQFNAADAIHIGFADYFVEHADIENLKTMLLDGKNLTAALDAVSSTPEQSHFIDLQNKIDTAFGHDSLLSCEQHLKALAQQGDQWASNTLDAMRTNAPLSMVTTFIALHDAKRKTSIEDCITIEYRVVYRALEQPDVYEGVRALLTDKDKNPQWEFAEIADVPHTRVEASLSSLDKNEWRPR